MPLPVKIDPKQGTAEVSIVCLFLIISEHLSPLRLP